MCFQRLPMQCALFEALAVKFSCLSPQQRVSLVGKGSESLSRMLKVGVQLGALVILVKRMNVV
jgi:hypothetical protein